MYVLVLPPRDSDEQIGRIIVPRVLVDVMNDLIGTECPTYLAFGYPSVNGPTEFGAVLDLALAFTASRRCCRRCCLVVRVSVEPSKPWRSVLTPDFSVHPSIEA